MSINTQKYKILHNIILVCHPVDVTPLPEDAEGAIDVDGKEKGGSTENEEDH